MPDEGFPIPNSKQNEPIEKVHEKIIDDLLVFSKAERYPQILRVEENSPLVQFLDFVIANPTYGISLAKLIVKPRTGRPSKDVFYNAPKTISDYMILRRAMDEVSKLTFTGDLPHSQHSLKFTFSAILEKAIKEQTGE